MTFSKKTMWKLPGYRDRGKGARVNAEVKMSDFRYTLCALSSKNYTCKCVKLELHCTIHTAGDYTTSTASCLIGSEKQGTQPQVDQNWSKLRLPTQMEVAM